MISQSKQTATREVAAAIRGRMISLTVLELFGNDLDELNRQLREKAALAPAFFRNAPLLLDFEHFDAEVDITWLDSAFRLMTDNYFVPVGITGAHQSLEDAARARGIAIWPSGGTIRKETEQELPTAEIKETATSTAPVHSVTQVVLQPIRSGQRVYAQGGDLIVLASVSTGAEVLADGHIHIYGSLRGRALAGVQGNEKARIFCHDLQADLVAIAGFYIISDDLPADKQKKAVQIYLHREELKIKSI